MQQSKRYRYIDDYKVVPYVGAGGKSKQRLEYIGKYVNITDDAAETMRLLRRVQVGVVLILLLLGTCLVLEHSASRTMYVAVPSILNVFPLAYMCIGAFMLPKRIEPMRRDAFAHSISRVQHSAIGIVAFCALTFIGTAVYWIFAGDYFLIIDAIFIAVTIAEAALSYTIYRRLKGIKTELLPNKA